MRCIIAPLHFTWGNEESRRRFAGLMSVARCGKKASFELANAANAAVSSPYIFEEALDDDLNICRSRLLFETDRETNGVDSKLPAAEAGRGCDGGNESIGSGQIGEDNSVPAEIAHV